MSKEQFSHSKARNSYFQSKKNNTDKPFKSSKENNPKKYTKENSNNASSESSHLVLPGYKPCLELLQSDPNKIDQLYIRDSRQSKDTALLLDLCREKRVRFALVNEEALRRLCGDSQHQGVAARLRSMSYVNFEDLLEQAFSAPLPLIIALDQVLDPGNVGTLVRTMYALGAAGLVVPRHNSAFLGPGAHRSAAGSLERLPIAEVVNLSRAVELAAKSGFTTYSADMDGINALEAPIESMQFPALLVLGSEEKGVRPGVQKHCDHTLSIPFLREFDSLNVAQAGGILTSCFARAYSQKKIS